MPRAYMVDAALSLGKHGRLLSNRGVIGKASSYLFFNGSGIAHNNSRTNCVAPNVPYTPIAPISSASATTHDESSTGCNDSGNRASGSSVFPGHRDCVAVSSGSDLATPAAWDTGEARRKLSRFFILRHTRRWSSALTELHRLENSAPQKFEARKMQKGDNGGVDQPESYDFVFQDTVRNVVLDTLARCARWREALELLDEMRSRGIPLDVMKLNSVLKACSVAKRWQVALRLLREMRDPRDGFLPDPDVISFNTVMAACARAGRTEEALSLLREMWMGQSIKDESTESSRCDGAGEVTEVAAKGTAAEPSAGGSETGHPSAKGISSVTLKPAPTPTLYSFNTALSACVRGGGESEGGEQGAAVSGAEKVLDLLDAMRRGEEGAPSPDATSFREAVFACGRAGQWERALSMVDAAVRDGVQASPALFAAAISACAQSGQWRRALSLLREDMPRWSVNPDKHCINASIRACARAGEVSEALRVIEVDFDRVNAMTGAGGPRPPKGSRLVRPCGFSFSPILDALALKGDKDQAMGVLREIKSRTGYLPNDKHYGAVVTAFLNFGDYDGARGVLAEWGATQAQRQGAADGGLTGVVDDAASKDSSPVPGSEGKGRRRNPADVFRRVLMIRSRHRDGASCLKLLKEAKNELDQAILAEDGAGAVEGDCDGEGSRNDGLQGDPSDGLDRCWESEGSWWKATLVSGEAEERSSRASELVRDRYEAAIDALGGEGRWSEALELLKEASRLRIRRSLLPRVDPSCFIPALESGSRSSDGRVSEYIEEMEYSHGKTGVSGEVSVGDPDAQFSSRRGGVDGGREVGDDVEHSQSTRCVMLLEAMHCEAGVTPNTRCVDVAMRACARVGAWGEVSRLFDDLEWRYKVGGRRVRAPGEGDTVCGDEDNFYLYSGVSPPAPHEARTRAGEDTAPTVLSYHLAIQACVAGFSDKALRGSETRSDGVEAGGAGTQMEEGAAERAVSLAWKLKSGGLTVRPDTIALANAACLKVGKWEAMRNLSELLRNEEARALERGGRWRRYGISAASEMSRLGAIEVIDKQSG